MMIDYEGFKRAGRFTLDTGLEVQGELSLKGVATSLDLYADAPFEVNKHSDIFGELLYDRSKVSLVRCIMISGPGYGLKNGEEYHFCSVFPHFVLFSKIDKHIHLSSSDQKIYRMSFAFDDADVVFDDFHAFGKVFKNKRSCLGHIFDVEDRKTAIGEDPEILYFTGQREIISIETVFGKITATNSTSYPSVSPKGINIANTILLYIHFTSEKTIDEAITTLHDLLTFFEVIAGRPQNISGLTFSSKWNTTNQSDQLFDVYWCKPTQRNTDAESGKPDQPLIQAVEKTDEFSYVLECWAEQHEKRRNARFRFSTAFAHQNNYTINRIIGAANMFDILPESIYPKIGELPSDLEEARCDARKIFRSLPVTIERNSVLGALGRIGKPSLKRKVRHRAKLITDIAGKYFPDIKLVIDQAVDLRNYYVHGTETKIDYGNNNQMMFFFTDTLEFVFAASDLIESGWDIAAWIEQRPDYYHPFGDYLTTYRKHLEELKTLLPHKESKS